MKIDGGHFYEDSLEITEDGGEGTHQEARRVPGAAPLGRAKHPPGCLVALLGAPSRLYDPLMAVKLIGLVGMPPLLTAPINYS